MSDHRYYDQLHLVLNECGFYDLINMLHDICWKKTKAAETAGHTEMTEAWFNHMCSLEPVLHKAAVGRHTMPKPPEEPLAKQYWLDFSDAKSDLNHDSELAEDMSNCTIGGWFGVCFGSPNDATPDIPQCSVSFHIDRELLVIEAYAGVHDHIICTFKVLKTEAHKTWDIYCIVDPKKQDAFRDVKKRMEAYGVRFLTEKPE